MKALLRYIVSFALVFAAAALGFVFTAPQIAAWYAKLVLPSFTPPPFLFGPVWTVLYFFMAIVFARVWGCLTSISRHRWFFAFALQLALNVLWSILFFGFHSLFLSVVDIVLLWCTLLILTLRTYGIDRLSFWLLLPYLLWVTYAMALNVGIWWIN